MAAAAAESGTYRQQRDKEIMHSQLPRLIWTDRFKWHALPTLLSATLTVIAWISVAAFRGTTPFGGSRNINDYYHQFLPFYATFWDVAHGQGPNDWQFNWYSGLGVPFLPDYVTYLAGPFSVIPLLFPRSSLELSLFLMMVTITACAAAAMTAYLRQLVPSANGWLAAMIGLAYGCCGWVFDDASYVPSWLNGLLALPLFAIVGEWARQRRRPVAGTLIIAVMWWANFYTAFMASLAAGALTLARCLAERDSWGSVARTMVSFAWRGVLGVGITSVTLVPLIKAVFSAQPSAGGRFHAVPLSYFAARSLPLSEGVGRTPSIYIAALVLVAAAAMPWSRQLSRATRLAYVGGVILLVASMQFAPTQLLWHDFDTPQGSSYRQAFVVPAWVAVMAWLTLASKSRLRAYLGGGAIITGLAVVAMTTSASEWLVPRWSVAIALAMVGVLVLCARYLAHSPRLLAAVVLPLILVEVIASGIVIESKRDSYLRTQKSIEPSTSAAREAAQQWYSQPQTWPDYRLTGINSLTWNEPALVGFPGIGYYSSTMSNRASKTLRNVGLAYAGWGRAIEASRATNGTEDDPAVDPLLAVSGRLIVDKQQAKVLPRKAFPVVRLLPRQRNASGPRDGASPFEVRNRLVRTPIYTIPELRYTLNGHPWKPSGTKITLLGTGQMTLSGTCRAGSLVQFDSHNSSGLKMIHGNVRRGKLKRINTGNNNNTGLFNLGPAPLTRQVVIQLAWHHKLSVSTHSVGCLNQQTLSQQIDQTAVPDIAIQGNAVSARWPQPVTGTAVVATAYRPGWSCVADRRATTSSRVGLLAVDMAQNTSLACTYQTPGLKLGALISALCLAVLTAVGLAGWWTRRKREAPTVP